MRRRFCSLLLSSSLGWGRVFAQDAHGTHLFAECMASAPSVETMVPEFKKKPETYIKVPRARFLVLYYQCLSLSAGESSPCRTLDGMGYMTLDDHSRTDLVALCRQGFDEAALAKAVITADAGAGKVCRRQDWGAKAGDKGAVCDLLVRSVDHPEAIKPRLKALLKGGSAEGRLRRMEIGMRMILGDPDGCAMMDPHDAGRNACSEYGKFKLAWKASDPRLCSGGGICGVMVGGGTKSCDAYLPELRDIYCDLRAGRLNRP